MQQLTPIQARKRRLKIFKWAVYILFMALTTLIVTVLS